MPTFDFTSPEGKTYSVQGPDGSTPEQAFQMLQQHLGAAPDVPQPSVMGDVAKQAAVGPALGLAGLAGAPGDIRGMASRATSALGEKLGVAPDKVQRFKDLAQQVVRFSSPIGPSLATGPTSQQVIESLESVTGKLPEAQTVPGQYVRTAGEFLPAMIGGPETIATKLATRVAAPALVSETAGQITKGTDLEPYARAVGALAGGAGASKFANSLAETKALKAATPSLSDVKSEASNAYDALTARNVAMPLKQSALDGLADDIQTTLNNKGIRPSNASSIHQAVEEIRSPATAGAADVADLVAARQSIKELLGKPDTNKAGAFVALNKIEQQIESASPGTMSAIKEADKNWSAVRASEALDKRVARAELRASGEHSGMNVGNKIRQQVTNYLLSNEAKYLSAETKADLQKIVKGTASQNLIRHVSNLLGGGGGLGMLVGGAAGYEAGGVPGAIAMGLAGRGLKFSNNRSVAKQAEQVGEAIRRRSPLGQTQQIPSSILPGVSLNVPRYTPPLMSSTALSALLPALLAYQKPLRQP